MLLRSRRLIGALCALLLVSCGPSDDATSSPETAAIPTPGLPSRYTGPDGTTSTVDSAARIVSLSGDFSEIVWELGLGPNLVGVDLSSVYPADVMAPKPKVGVEFRLFAEPILDVSPTVVIGDVDASPHEVIQQVRGAGVPVVIVPRLVGTSAPAEKIMLVGDLLGVPQAASRLADRVQREIDDALARAAGASSTPRVAVVYVATEDQVLLLGEGTVFQGLIEAAGGEDVGPPGGAEGFAPLSAEVLVAASPDVIITAQRGFEDRGGMEGFLDLPGLAQTPAGRDERILVYEDTLLLNLGPRTGELLERLVVDLHPELAGGG